MADPKALRRQLQDGTHVLLLDGATSTELEKDPRIDWAGTCLWSAALMLESRKALRPVLVDLYRRYLEAGSDVISTVSYQASVDGFRREGVIKADEDNADAALEPFLDISIGMAKQARDEWLQHPHPGRVHPLIGASIGCYGAALADGSEFRGDYGLDRAGLEAWHRARFAYFAAHPDVDVLMCETIPCLVEVEAFVDLLNAYPEAVATISVSCRDGTTLNSGEPIADLAPILGRLQDPTQLLSVGINCTAPCFAEALLQSFNWDGPKHVYPNRGETWDHDANDWKHSEAAEGADASWTDYLTRWYAAGARVFGGCCRTGPDDIKVMREFFEEKQRCIEKAQ